jgi:membrane protein DedA with SNARE-associated domain
MSGTEALLMLGSSPVAIAVAIVLTTLVLEDAATIAAALLAASGIIDAPLAVAALCVGIFAGDVGLYGLGAAARSQEWARRRVGEAQIEKGRAWLSGRLAAALITARFIPGLRLPAYSASGFLGIPFRAFITITALASLVWTTFAFSLVYTFGANAIMALGPWMWAAGLALVIAVAAGPAFARHLDRTRL